MSYLQAISRVERVDSLQLYLRQTTELGWAQCQKKKFVFYFSIILRLNVYIILYCALGSKAPLLFLCRLLPNFFHMGTYVFFSLQINWSATELGDAITSPILRSDIESTTSGRDTDNALFEYLKLCSSPVSHVSYFVLS